MRYAAGLTSGDLVRPIDDRDPQRGRRSTRRKSGGTGKRKGRNPSLASIYRALAEHDKRQAYPQAVEQAHADFAALQAST
jgi:hypothetical protein